MAVDPTLWIGTSKGLARTLNGGVSWEHFRTLPEFVNDGIFAIAVRSDTIWTSTGFTKEVDDNDVQTGSGYTFSFDNGATWQHFGQTIDSQEDSVIEYGINQLGILPVVVSEQNVTFDIALSSGTVWIASWASGLRKSTDNGQTWRRIVLPPDTRNGVAPTDTLDFFIDPRQNNNFLAFGIFAQSDSVIWCGTAGGINKSTDGGVSWVKFNHQNQDQSILGNWVIAIEEQRYNGKSRVWTTNWRTDDPDEQFGVSYTDDGGQTWVNLLHDIRAFDFAFKDSIVYVATENGLYRTDDGGISWTRSSSIIDPSTRQQITTPGFFAVGLISDTVYAGSGDGMVKTVDNVAVAFGSSWQVLRTFESVGSPSETYAYPNPFSPDDEVVRFHYSTGGKDASVTIDVFDFGMNRVRTVIRNAARTGAREHDEIWDGRDNEGNRIANGAYFYRIQVDEDEPIWEKVLLIQ